MATAIVRDRYIERPAEEELTIVYLITRILAGVPPLGIRLGQTHNAPPPQAPERRLSIALREVVWNEMTNGCLPIPPRGLAVPLSRASHHALQNRAFNPARQRLSPHVSPLVVLIMNLELAIQLASQLQGR